MIIPNILYDKCISSYIFSIYDDIRVMNAYSFWGIKCFYLCNCFT